MVGVETVPWGLQIIDMGLPGGGELGTDGHTFIEIKHRNRIG